MSNKYPFIESTLGKKLEAGTGFVRPLLWLPASRGPRRCRTGEPVRAGPALLTLGSAENHLLPRMPRRRPRRSQSAVHQSRYHTGTAREAEWKRFQSAGEKASLMDGILVALVGKSGMTPAELVDDLTSKSTGESILACLVRVL